MEKIRKSPLPDVNVSEKEFVSTFFDGFKKCPDGIAFEDVSTGKAITFQQLLTKAEIFGRSLLRAGCSKGDVVANYAPNSLDCIIVIVASIRIGAVIACLNDLLSTDEAKHQLTVSDAKFVFTTETLAPQIASAAGNLPIKVIVKGDFEGCISFGSMLEESDRLPALRDVGDLGIKPQDPIAILFSSGTTGPPKAILITNYNIHVLNMQYRNVGINFAKQMIAHQLFHLSALGNILMGCAHSSRTFFMSKLEFRLILKCIQDHKLMTMFLSPANMHKLLRNPEVDEYDLKDLKVLLCGGGPIASEMEDELMTKFPGVAVFQAYGMTESVAGIALPSILPGSQRKPGTVGVPAVNVQVKVVDTKTGEALGPGEHGEICAKSPAMSPGYKNNPEATARLIDNDGWLHTGDLGYYDEDGFFFIVERIKELIKWNGFHVVPSRLEMILLSHPSVAEAGVVGVRDEAVGELPTAVVVLTPDSKITEEELEQFVAGKVAQFERLHGGIHFVSSIPRTALGKMQRHKVRQQLQQPTRIC